MILLVTGAVAAVGLVYGIHRYALDWLFYRLPPGPFPRPFIGNFGIFPTDGKTKTWHILQQLAKKYQEENSASVFRIYFGQQRCFILNDAKLINEILVGQSKIFNWRIDNFIPGYENVPPGIVSGNYEHWQRFRRFGMRAMRDFGMGKEAMVVNIHNEVGHFIAELNRTAKQPLEPKTLLSNTVSNVICSLVFGKRFDFDDLEFRKLTAKIQEIIQRPPTESAVFFMAPVIKYFKTFTDAVEMTKMQRITTEMVAKMVDHHRVGFDPRDIRDFPDLFIQAENSDDPIDMKTFGVVMTDMFMAGTETTSTALSWVLLYLSLWPEVKTKCQRLIDEVIESDRLPDLKDRAKLPYLDAVMYETLRLSSMVPGGVFHSNLDVPTKIQNYDCPPYTMIMYNAYLLQNDPDYWGDPDVFRPERWIDENGNLMSHAGHFLAFGIGPRICLGEALAKVEFFIFITSILHRFDFELNGPVDLRDSTQGSVIHSPPNYEIVFTPRN